MPANFFIDSKNLRSIKVDLQTVAKQIPGATASALNRTLDFTATKTVKEVTNEYTIKQKNVKATLKKVKARGKALYAYLSSRGPKISLGAFSHTPKNYNAKAKVVKVKEKKVVVLRLSKPRLNHSFKQYMVQIQIFIKEKIVANFLSLNCVHYQYLR